MLAEQQGLCSAGGAGSAGASPLVTAGASLGGARSGSPQQLGGQPQLHRLHSAPAHQAGVAGWLEGWRRLAEEQGCAVGRPGSARSSSSECAGILPPPAAYFPGPLEPQRPRSAPAPALLHEPFSSPLLAACNPLQGSVQAVAAPPPLAQFPSPFQSDLDAYAYASAAAAAAAAATPPRGACSPEAVLARMQQQQVCGGLAAPPAAGGSSEDSGASPLRSYSR